MKSLKSKLFDYSFYLTVFLVFLSIFSNHLKAQDKLPAPQAVKKAEEILNLSRKVLRGKNVSEKINGLSATFFTDSQTIITRAGKSLPPSEETGEIKIDFSSTDKVRYAQSKTNKGDNSQSFYNFTLNNDKYKPDSYTIFNSKRDDNNYIFNQKSEEEKRETILEVKRQNFLRIFPLILESPNYVPLNFYFIGIAEADGEKADVLEAILPKQSNLRLFFDKNSHLLKLIIYSGKNKIDKDYEEKRYFSDYKEMNGFMIPAKTIFELKSGLRDGEYNTKEELTLKSFKVNPAFKSDNFEIKN
jgi:hypothetical protein